MRRLIFYFLILLLSIWIGIKVYSDSGYVLISYKNWSVETSFWFALLMLVVAWAIIYLLIKLLGSIYGVSDRWQRWTGNRKIRKARKLTSRGLCELAEGNWQRAEKLLIRDADHSEMPLINYLAAAHAAQQQKIYERRDNYLRKAYDCTGGAEELAVGLTQAQLQLNSNQLEHALATLRHLNQIAPHHTYVLKLLQKVGLQLQDWKELRMLIPELRKYGVLSEPELTQLERQVYLALLADTAKTSPSIEKAWDMVPRHLQKDPVLISAYVNYLIERNLFTPAEKLLRHVLHRHWSEDLIYKYGEIVAEDPAKQLSTAENWLKAHPNDLNLLLTLGKICARNRLWGKARYYLESCLRLEPNVEVYKELGTVLEQLGEKQAALNCYKAGLGAVDIISKHYAVG